MRFIENTTIGRRLGAAFGLVLLLLAAVAGVAAVQIGRVNENVRRVTENTVPSLKMVRAVGSQLAALERLAGQHIASTDKAEMAAVERSLDQARASLAQALEQYGAAVSNSEDRLRWQQTRTSVADYLALWDKFLPVSRSTVLGNPVASDAARALINGEMPKAIGVANTAVNALWEYNEKNSDEHREESKLAHANALTLLAAFAAVSMCLGVAASMVISRSITRPIHEAAAIASAIADGDMTRTVEVRGCDETAQMLRALITMQSNLTRMIGTVRLFAESVAAASSGIAQGNADLSQRTEQQASVLQESATSMVELAATVRSNADNAHQADRLAKDASAVAQQGGQVVAEVVDTMRGINSSSKKISDIIAVIDGIAFQTNILALNAAVEAARAGEEGRGFAVVANEVRNLAQRSANAAKEIKALITASVERVEQGTTLVDRAGETIQSLVISIAQLSSVVSEISAASREQSSGVAQVGKAVGQMDQSTQKNTALVEKSAGAAESLRQQAHQLSAAVAVFKLSGMAVGE